MSWVSVLEQGNQIVRTYLGAIFSSVLRPSHCFLRREIVVFILVIMVLLMINISIYLSLLTKAL